MRTTSAPHGPIGQARTNRSRGATSAVRGLVAGVLALAALAAGPTARSAEPPDFSDAITMDCAGWSITGLPADDDPDGDGSVMVQVTIQGGTLADETFTFPAGTLHDLAGTYSVPPTMNPLAMSISGSTSGGTYLGACDSNPWSPPGLQVQAYIDPGATEFFVALRGSCYGTTVGLVLVDAAEATIGEWVIQATTRDPGRSFATLSVPGGLSSGTYRLDEICGTFEAPRSEPASVMVLVAAAPTTTTEGAPPAEPTDAAATFTG